MSGIETSEVLVTGGGGRLGQALAALGCRTLSRQDLDITDKGSILRAMQAGDVRCVINAAAYTAVDAAEADREAAERVNGLGAGLVAEVAAGLGAPVIQVSTDCVFGDGDPALPVREDAPTGPLSVYGASKRQGEILVRQAAGTCCLVRVAWLFDDSPTTFIGKMLKIAAGREVLSVVDDEWGRPTPLAALAEQLMQLAAMMVAAPDSVPDMLHLGPPNPVSRYDWAVRIFEASARSGGPAPRLERVSASAFATAARRPRGLVLDVSRAEALLGPMPDWMPFSDAAVARLLA